MKRIYQEVAAFAVSILLLMTGRCDAAAASGDSSKAPGFVGIRCKPDEGWLAVGGVAENSPASRAGLAGGERILKINGQSTQNKPARESAMMLMGAAGEKVTLTLLRPGDPNAQPFEITLVRDPLPDAARMPRQETRAVKADWTRPPTREAGPVEWKGNKIISRVMPYPDFISMFIRLPIAHATALGQGVKIGIIQLASDENAQILVQNVAPRAEVATDRCQTNSNRGGDWVTKIASMKRQIVLIADPEKWPPGELIALAEGLIARNVLVVIPADLSEDPAVIGAINQLQGAGALTVGRVDRQSLLHRSIESRDSGLPFNRKIGEIRIDLFSTMGCERNTPAVIAAASAAGMAALVREKWPQLSASEVRTKMIQGARAVWQMMGTSAPVKEMPVTVDPITTQFKIKDEKTAFRFRVLDAAGALGIDTELPWMLNMLNVQKAWEITKGQGVLVLVTDQGFHIQHPTLARSLESAKHFGMKTFNDPDQNFHGTDMSRILLAIAPEARIVPVLCSGNGREELARNIAQSFRYAVEAKADVISSSWAGWFNSDENLLAAVRQAVESGVVVSWFHYPKACPGVLRTTFTYAGGWHDESRLGLLDRFFLDPPGFHPVEIEAGLSATAPQAAAIAALVKSVNSKLTPRQIEELIFKNATPLGGGILIPDVAKTVLAAKETIL